MVVRAGSVHCCTIGCDCSRTCGDCSNGASTKRIDIQEVLAVNNDQIDEGHNLTDVGHGTTNVDGAKRLRDALEHVEGCAECALFALVDVHGLVDGKPHVCDVGCHHPHIHHTLHSVADGALSNQQSSASNGLVSQNADLSGGQ
eukprot:Skav208088  [mRNA]  locus=scaffold1681:90800:91521:+ [translate_table: standard]